MPTNNTTALDRLNAAIESAETFLQRYTCKGEVPFSGSNKLIWKVQTGKWSLWICSSYSSTPLLKGSIAQRVEGASLIPLLVAELEFQQTQQDQEVAKAASSLFKFLKKAMSP